MNENAESVERHQGMERHSTTNRLYDKIDPQNSGLVLFSSLVAWMNEFCLLSSGGQRTSVFRLLQTTRLIRFKLAVVIILKQCPVYLTGTASHPFGRRRHSHVTRTGQCNEANHININKLIGHGIHKAYTETLLLAHKYDAQQNQISWNWCNDRHSIATVAREDESRSFTQLQAGWCLYRWNEQCTTDMHEPRLTLCRFLGSRITFCWFLGQPSAYAPKSKPCAKRQSVSDLKSWVERDEERSSKPYLQKIFLWLF